MPKPSAKVQRRPIRDSAKVGRITRQGAQKAVKQVMNGKVKPSQDVQPLSTFLAGAAGFLEQIHQTRRPLVITQHGRSSAVVLDVEECEAMVEELDVIRDIRIGLQQMDAGQGIPHEEVMAQLRSMLPE